MKTTTCNPLDIARAIILARKMTRTRATNPFAPKP